MAEQAQQGRRFPPRATWFCAIFFVGVFVVQCLGRLPRAEWPMLDMDEAVSALIAASWLEGGVPYRDAIDQRGPVTYAIYALVFAVSGTYNMLAVHWTLLTLVLLCACMVFFVGRWMGGPVVGYLAATVFALSNFTYHPIQLLSYHTEWTMIVFNASAVLLFLRALGGARAHVFVLTGVCFAMAFFSKQPAVFDAAGIGLFYLLYRWKHQSLGSFETLRQIALMLAGFAVVAAAWIFYFWLAGGLGDFFYYFYTYNVEHYAAVVPFSERVQNWIPFVHKKHYLTANPVLLVAVAVQTIRGVWRLARGRHVDARLFAVIWFVFAYAGAAFGGRNFGHYYIQIFLPACLLTAGLIADLGRVLWRWLRGPGSPAAAMAVGYVFLAATAAGLLYPVQKQRRFLARNPAWKASCLNLACQRLLAHIHKTTDPSDSIFVWGYNPEIYVLSRRRPATRYSNTNYLTGLLPWENQGRDVDTSAHIVEGAWDILMQELETSRPAVIIDASIGNLRHYGKYPPSRFPRLADYLDRHYRPEAVMQTRRGRPYYRVYRRLHTEVERER